MRVELKRLHRTLGTTIIYVTHDQMEAMTLADRIAVINEGVYRQYAPPLETYKRPADSFVATFIGNPAMNLLKGNIEPHERGYSFHSGSFSFDLPRIIARAVYEYKPSSSAVSFGIRPEDVVVKPGADRGAGMDGKGPLTGSVYGLEALGSRDYAFIRAGKAEITAEVPAGSGLSIGDTCRIFLASPKGHIFDGKGRAIC